jgi:hypothetical protein
MELPCSLIPSRPLDCNLDFLPLVGDLAMYTWGSALASQNYFRKPPPAGVPRCAQNDMAVHLFHEVCRGAAFDLVSESRSSDLVLDAARRLVSGDSLAQAADSLLERIVQLPSEAAEAAFALMHLWRDTKVSGFQIDCRIMPKSLQARRNYMRGLLTYDDFCFAVYGEARDLLDRLLEALSPQPSDKAVSMGICFSDFGLGYYPVHRTPVSLWHGVPVYEVSWHYGYVRAMASAAQNWPLPRSKKRSIDICPQAIERAACRIVLPEPAEPQVPVVAAALGRLAERLGPDPAGQLGHVRAALTDLVLWHEVGHVWSLKWIGKVASGARYRDADPVWWTTVKEFYAECRAARQILHAGDGLGRDVFLLFLLGHVEPQERLTPQLPSYRWPIARALVREDGLRYLSSLERALRRMLGGVPLRSVDQWLGRQADDAVEDLRAELTGGKGLQDAGAGGQGLAAAGRTVLLL